MVETTYCKRPHNTTEPGWKWWDATAQDYFKSYRGYVDDNSPRNFEFCGYAHLNYNLICPDCRRKAGLLW